MVLFVFYQNSQGSRYSGHADFLVSTGVLEACLLARVRLSLTLEAFTLYEFTLQADVLR